MIKVGHYDLLIFDYEMPDLDGKELTEKVRAYDEFDLIPVLILTALNGNLDKKTIISSGIQSYLVKLDKEELLEETEKLLTLELVES